MLNRIKEMELYVQQQEEKKSQGEQGSVNVLPLKNWVNEALALLKQVTSNY